MFEHIPACHFKLVPKVLIREWQWKKVRIRQRDGEEGRYREIWINKYLHTLTILSTVLNWISLITEDIITSISEVLALVLMLFDLININSHKWPLLMILESTSTRLTSQQTMNAWTWLSAGPNKYSMIMNVYQECILSAEQVHRGQDCNYRYPKSH